MSRPDDPPATLGRTAAPGDATTAPRDATTAPGGRRPAPPAGGPVIPGLDFVRVLGEGGMGRVYLAVQTGLRREVAVKVVAAAGGEAEARRFGVEAQAVARVAHPNVLGVFEVGTAEGRPYLVLEYAPGGSLADRLKAGVTFTPAEAALLLERVARGVAAAHAVGVVHRDLKPGNVLLAGDGTPKVADFGLAKMAHAAADLTRTDQILGTPLYMPPEQVTDSRLAGPGADVWALGVMLYQLLTGVLPFRGETAGSVIHQVLIAEPARPRAVRRSVPAALERIVLRCLRRDPAERYPNAAALADALERWRLGRPPDGTRRRLALALAALAALVALAAGAMVALRPGEPVAVASAEEATTAFPEFVRVPAGTFRMGSDGGKVSERPAHSVTLTRPFLLGRCEVTVGQFRAFVTATGYRTAPEESGEPLNWADAGFPQTDEHPVTLVNRADAAAYCAWLGRATGRRARLPSEAEWEYACRAGAATVYSCGDDPEGVVAVGNAADAAAGERFPDWPRTAGRDGYAFTAPVGRFPPNAFGLCDMHGNVWEWCADIYAAYAGGDRADPVPRPPSPAEAGVARGGCWADHPANCRSSQRLGVETYARYAYGGFRVAADIDEREPE